MTNRHFYRAIIIRILCIIALTVAASYLLFEGNKPAWAVILMLLCAATVFNTLAYINSVNRWIASFLLGIENEDSSLKIPQYTGNKAIDEIFKGLSRLNDLFRKTKIEIGTQEQYYLSIINQSATGLFSVNTLGRIININPAAEKLTGLIAYHHINTLARISEFLPAFIMDDSKLQESGSAIFENQKGQKLLFKLSEIVTPDEVVKLVVVSDITKELDNREVDAWIKLARTLSHEIMNNMAPITTLSQVTLNYFVQEEKAISPDQVNQETVNKTIKGLRVIEERSSGLQKFVDNYRKFTKLPEPELLEVDLSTLVSKVLLICSGFDGYKETQVEASLPDSCLLSTDENLLSQVLINIIKNALETRSESNTAGSPFIRIKIREEAGFIYLDISNNGEKIPPELREQIFVPFFTTKENGSGIGLSLSKQVMLKLGGDIQLRTDIRDVTCFSLSLPK